jgi:hypothetical protein
MLDHLLQCFVALSLLHDLVVLEVVEPIGHAKPDFVFVFYVAEHQLLIELLKLLGPHHPKLYRN